MGSTTMMTATVKLHHDVAAAVIIVVEPIEPVKPPEPDPELADLPIEPPNPYADDYDDD